MNKQKSANPFKRSKCFSLGSFLAIALLFWGIAVADVRAPDSI